MRYVATGRIMPERTAVSFPRVQIRLGDRATAIVSADSSQVTVILDDPSADEQVRAWIVASHVATDIATAIGFAKGCGYSVEITQVVDENNVAHVFGVKPEGLEFTPYGPIIDRALQLGAENLCFRLALRDYARAITDVTDCATYCYRAIEAIHHGFPSWAEMHEALGTNEAAIKTQIKDYADTVRHGNWVAAKETTSSTRFAMLTLTRDILAKYLDYARPQPPAVVAGP